MPEITVPELLNLPPKLMQVLTSFNSYKHFILEGGRGCVHKDTLINTPNGEIKIKDYKGGEIYSFDGKNKVIAYACKPIQYTKEPLYKVSFDNGKYITVTSKHKFFTNVGWQELSALDISASVFQEHAQEPFSHLQTNLDTCQIGLHADAQRLMRKLVGYLYHYWQDYCQCGVLPLSVANTYRDVLQQLVDAKGHISHVSKQTGDLGTLNKHDLLQFSNLLSILAFLHEEEEQNYKDKGNCIYEISSVLLSASYQLSQQCFSKTSLSEQVLILSEQLLYLCSVLEKSTGNLKTISDILLLCVDDNSYSNSFVCNHAPHYTAYTNIVNIEPQEDDYYYDMFVPFYNCYFAEGVLNHNSGKSQSVARILLYLASIAKIRTICLREVQKSIEESVHQLFKDLILKYKLDFEIQKTVIFHRKTGSTFKFKGLQDNTSDTIKSTEGVDIVWVEEAQSIAQQALDALIPTPRKETVKFFYTMNRFVRNDPVFETLNGRQDCLTIHIDYFENQFCPMTLIEEANICKAADLKKYNHIWLGEPLDKSCDYLFSGAKLIECFNRDVLGSPIDREQRGYIFGIDVAGQGGDICAAVPIEQVSAREWIQRDVIRWDGKDTDSTVGRVISINSKYNPDLVVFDKAGMGYPMYNTLAKSIDIYGFNGAENENCKPNEANHRASAYLKTCEMIEAGELIITDKAIKSQAEQIKKEYQRNGKILIESKESMKRRGIKSPDELDALTMAVFGITKVLHKKHSSGSIRAKVYHTEDKRGYGWGGRENFGYFS